jgi:hypothetical protein
VATVFGGIEPDVLERFTPTALYRLSEPGVPQSLREYAAEQAQDGTHVTAGLVQEWLEAYREVPTSAPLKLAPKDDAVVNVNTDAVHAADNWRLLTELVGRDGSVHFAASHDTDEAIDDLWVIGVYTKQGKDGNPPVRRTATHNNLERTLLSLCGVVRSKECPKCGKTKSLDEFSRRKDRPDGRNTKCLSCERERVKEFERKRREAMKAAKAAM